MSAPFRAQRVCIAITGASGSVYAERLLQFLVDQIERVYVIASEAGAEVSRFELLPRRNSLLSLVDVLDAKIPDQFKPIIRLQNRDDLFSPIASGTSAPDAMVIVPASMGTVARIAHGFSGNLIERAADVVMKEKKRLIMVPRETPLSPLHLENMLKLSKMDVDMIAAMPAFYNKPQSIDDMVDFVVGRVVDRLGIDHNLYKKWNERMR